MDVHRKRSQVAIVEQAGAVQRICNLPNDPAELLPIPGGLPAGTPVAFEAAAADARVPIGQQRPTVDSSSAGHRHDSGSTS